MANFVLLITLLLKVGRVTGAPNILFILADDMGQWAAGTYGNPEIITPNIDRLAKEGVQFENAFCNTPVCSASRASYFTGRLPSQHGVHDWIAGGNGCSQTPIFYTREETAYTDVLAQHGYICGISGKYHLGDQQQPQHSFSHWFVHQSGGGDYNDPPMVKDGQCVHPKGYITDIITNDAIEFITTTAKMGKPFYASVHYTAPHSPYTGADGRADSMHPKEIVDQYSNCSFSFLPQEPMNPYANYTGGFTRACLGNRQCLLGYYAAVTAMDNNIGRLLSTLDNLTIADKTLVVFASDHGFNAGQHGLWGKGNAVYPLNMFDTSLKIPMIFRHTGVLEPYAQQSHVQVCESVLKLHWSWQRDR
jgi:arylsulfatase A-like enzyme